MRRDMRVADVPSFPETATSYLQHLFSACTFRVRTYSYTLVSPGCPGSHQYASCLSMNGCNRFILWFLNAGAIIHIFLEQYQNCSNNESVQAESSHHGVGHDRCSIALHCHITTVKMCI